jgi:hypothetical protein
VPLLYVDLLGMKARYVGGGVRAARRGYTLLGELVASGLGALPEGRPVTGGVQSDAAALQFATATDAVIVGRAIFRKTFARSARNRRLWIRGVVMSGSYPDAALQREDQLAGAPAGVFERHFTDTLLRAVNVEQAGFRGQLLLIEEQLVTAQLENALSWQVGDGRLLPAHRLRYSQYPRGLDAYRDVLWPVADDIRRWPLSYTRLLDRLRWAADGGDAELVQASATHLLFAEIDAILHGLGGPSAAPRS